MTFLEQLKKEFILQYSIYKQKILYKDPFDGFELETTKIKIQMKE
jgi:hypothetical protein